MGPPGISVIFYFLMNLVFMYQVDVLMTPPRIEHVRTAHTRVTFGENFQVSVSLSTCVSVCLSLFHFMTFFMNR